MITKVTSLPKKKRFLTIVSTKFSFPQNIRNLHLSRHNCSWDRLVPSKHHLFFSHEPTFDNEYTYPTLLRLHCLRRYPCKTNRTFPRNIPLRSYSAFYWVLFYVWILLLAYQSSDFCFHFDLIFVVPVSWNALFLVRLMPPAYLLVLLWFLFWSYSESPSPGCSFAEKKYIFGSKRYLHLRKDIIQETDC
jgi:hypothetical protein